MIEPLGEPHHSGTVNMDEMREKINEIIEQINGDGPKKKVKQ